jgi:hypothetical protein
MNSEVFKTPNLNQAIEVRKQWEKEEEEILKTVPQLRIRLGDLIRKHIPFPEKAEGKKIKFKSSRANQDWIKVGSSFLPNRKILGPTGLICMTRTEKGELGVIVKSSAYPFEERHVTLTVDIKELGCSFEIGNEAKFKEKNTEHGNVNLNQVNMLKEVLTLIENPNITRYEPLPYHLIKIK